MDLTPPSLTTSPSSPLQKSIESPPPFLFQSYCMPETTSADIYPSLPLLDHSYIPPPYGSMDHQQHTLPHSMDTDALDPVSQHTAVSWNPASVTSSGNPAATTAPSSMPNMMAADYEHFAAYENSCLPATYGSSAAYQRTATQSPAYLRTPPPSSTDVTGRPTSYSARPSFGFVHETMGSKPLKVTDPLSYGTPSSAASPYSGYQATRSRFSSQIFADEYQNQAHVSAPPSIHSASPVPTGQYQASSQVAAGPSSAPSIPEPGNRNWTRIGKNAAKRRPARKHTTKEEANFQCMVKGCGKFFSRSYNFKSHMETHDERREYPFPCQEPNCTKKFVRKTDLQRHHQSVHTKERNHKCDFCGRLFARKDTQRRFVFPSLIFGVPR
jgi:hypothetical protein